MKEKDSLPPLPTIGEEPPQGTGGNFLGKGVKTPKQLREEQIKKVKEKRKLQKRVNKENKRRADERRAGPPTITKIVEEDGQLVEKVYKKKPGRPPKDPKDDLAGYVEAFARKLEEENKAAAEAAKDSLTEVTKKPEEIKEGEHEYKETDRKVIWEPGSDVIREFLSSSEDEVLISGGRGSGKSLALIVDPLRYCTNKNFRGLVLRHTMVELRELISRAQEIYPQIFPGVNYQKSNKIFVFPSGARIEFGYCDKLPDDLEQYKGQEYQWLGLDELTQWHSEEVIEKMRGSLRTTDPDLPVTLRSTSNPDGVGRLWVKERYVDAAPAGKTAVFAYDTPIGKQYVTRKWLHSTVYDNPFILKNNPSYVGWLHSLKGRLREVWLDGSWDAADGMAFDEFDRRIHVIEPFEIPSTWPRFCAIDWGYGNNSLAVCNWFAVDHEGHVYIYREFVANGNVPVEQKFTASQFARKIAQIEQEEKDWTSYTVVDGATNQDHGASGIGGKAAPTIFEQMRQATPRRKWKFAKKGKGSRKAGKQIVHDYLSIDPVLKKPKLQIFSTCVQLIKELSSLPLDPNDPEDVDTKAEDHCFTEGHEILTDKGWKDFKDLDGFEKVATLTDTNEILYQKPVDYICSDYKGEILSYDGCGMRFEVTPNHKFCVKTPTNAKNWALKTFNELPDKALVPIDLNNPLVTSELKKQNFEKRYYEGKIYCVTVPEHHTIYVRKDGKPMWIGQSYDSLRYGLTSRPERALSWDPWEAKPVRRYNKPINYN